MSSNKVTTIFFSKDRPLQLDLCLVSNQKCSEEWESQNEVVIFKASTPEYEKAYKQVMYDHPSTSFVKELDFKDCLLLQLKEKPDYLLFVVDDCIFTGKYSLSLMANALEDNKNAIGFSLRLGENTKECYPIKKKNTIPNFYKLEGYYSGTIIFDWKKAGEGDFSYPLDVSSSLYRVKDIEELLKNCDYNNPNSLEWDLYCNTNYISNLSMLLSYQTSVAFCNPINKVQQDNKNRAGTKEKYSLDSLLKKYNNGYRAKYNPFEGFVSNGCHQEVDIELIKEIANG